MKRKMATAGGRGFQTAALLSLLFCGAGAAAQEQHAHEHGVGHLNLAIDGGVVEVELAVPGADIVGFEHEAETAEDKQAINRAIEVLNNGASLFAFSEAAKCSLDNVRVATEELDEKEHDEKHHDKDEHEKAGHDEEDHDGHMEFHAHYRFNCLNPTDLTYIEVSYFKAFPAARELEVQALTPRGQKGGELTAGSPRLTF